MDQLIELGIRTDLAKVLSDDGWTPGKIATAGVSALTIYKGIGRQTALKWIRAAQLKINQCELAEGLAMEKAEGLHRAPAAAPRVELPRASVRVKRIQEGNQ